MKLLPKQSGIYKVVNLLNNHCYIGQAKNIYKRFNSHHKTDYLNKNNSCYNTKFYKALRKYGWENFDIIVLELCEEKELNQKEKYYIALFDTFHNGYNSTEGGTSQSPNIHSVETEEKRRKTREKNCSLMGQNHPKAKLTDKEVILIRQRYKDGETCKQIHKDYEYIYPSLDVFKRIVLGRSYKTVGNIPKKDEIRYTNAKLLNFQVKEIRKRYKEEKISAKKLGKEYGVSETTVYRIIHNQIYKNID